MASRDPDLARAIRYWKQGIPAPTDLWAKLSARGYDLYALEEAHFQF